MHCALPGFETETVRADDIILTPLLRRLRESAVTRRSRLIDLKQQYTTVIVTHTLRQAKRLADYVIYMYMGEVIEAGTAKEVFSNPKHERTKQYLEGLF